MSNKEKRAGEWVTGDEHPTTGEQKEKLGETHTDTIHYDERGDRDSGKLKVSGPKYEPSMKDVQEKE